MEFAASRGSLEALVLPAVADSQRQGAALQSPGSSVETTPLARALAGTRPCVDALEQRLRSGGLTPVQQGELDAWRALLGGRRSERSLAADTVLLALCARLAGERPEFLHLRALREACPLDDGTVEAARQACRTHGAMLGPLYEALALRQERYALGQYFTPEALAEFMAGVLRPFHPASVLEPALGAGALLAPLPPDTSVVGVDVSPLCLALASAGLAVRGFTEVTLRCEDFLAGPRPSHPAPAQVDAVLCNPPYLRHHLLAKEQKQRLTRHYGARFEATLSALSTSYVWFFLEALERLRDGGLLVFLTPADFLDTRYGEGLKDILRRHTTVEEVLLFDREALAFAGVLTTSAVTIARKGRPARGHRARFSEASLEAGGVVRRVSNDRPVEALEPGARWSTYFGQRESSLLALRRDRPRVLSDYLRIRRGMATGANDFFVIPQAVVEAWALEPEFLLRVVASVRDLPDDELTEAHWQELRARGRPCWLLNVERPREAVRGLNVDRYLAHGERLGIHERFNCRTRSPWYRQERVEPPDVIITYMNRGLPRFVLNRAGCRVMSVFLNGFLTPRAPALPELVAALRSPTTGALLAQWGRMYGGGLGKVEPRELASLPMPELASLSRCLSSLSKCQRI